MRSQTSSEPAGPSWPHTSIQDVRKTVLQVMERIHSQFQASTSEVAAVPLHGLSAKTGEGAQELLPAAMHLYDTWNKRLTTSRLNAWKEKVAPLFDRLNHMPHCQHSYSESVDGDDCIW